MKPTVGRIVHYVSHGTPVRGDGTQAYTAQCRAAIITEIGADGVGLCVLNPSGQFFNRDVPYDGATLVEGTDLCDGANHPGGTWHWPNLTAGDPR